MLKKVEGGGRERQKRWEASIVTLPGLKAPDLNKHRRNTREGYTPRLYKQTKNPVTIPGRLLGRVGSF